MHIDNEPIHFIFMCFWRHSITDSSISSEISNPHFIDMFSATIIMVSSNLSGVWNGGHLIPYPSSNWSNHPWGLGFHRNIKCDCQLMPSNVSSVITCTLTLTENFVHKKHILDLTLPVHVICTKGFSINLCIWMCME